MRGMTTINVFEAKSAFSKLVAAAEAGETVIIARNGRPVAKLGPIGPAEFPRFTFGDLAGQIEIPGDFDDWTAADDAEWFGSGESAQL